LKLAVALLALGVKTTTSSSGDAYHEVPRAESPPLINSLLDVEADLRLTTRDGQTAPHEVIPAMVSCTGLASILYGERRFGAGVNNDQGAGELQRHGDA
jgi:hypothetical protein